MTDFRTPEVEKAYQELLAAGRTMLTTEKRMFDVLSGRSPDEETIDGMKKAAREMLRDVRLKDILEEKELPEDVRRHDASANPKSYSRPIYAAIKDASTHPVKTMVQIDKIDSDIFDPDSLAECIKAYTGTDHMSITFKKNVMTFYIGKLIEINDKLGAEPEFSAVMQTYLGQHLEMVEKYAVFAEAVMPLLPRPDAP